MDLHTAHSIEEQYNRTWGEFLLWFGVFGGGVAWSLHLQSMYVLTQSACARHTMLPLHVTSVVMVSLSALAIVVSWRDWSRIGTDWPSGIEGGVSGRSRFLAVMGVFLNLLFTQVIICQWITVFYFRPCV